MNFNVSNCYLSSDRLAKMKVKVNRVAAAARRAGRARVRMEAWVVREGAREARRRGGPAPAPVPVPAPVLEVPEFPEAPEVPEVPEVVPVAQGRSSSSRSPSPLGARLQVTISSSQAPGGSGRRSASAPRRVRQMPDSSW